MAQSGHLPVIPATAPCVFDKESNMPIKPTNRTQIINQTAFDTTFTGGNARDEITIWGNGNTLDGGNGTDLLVAFGERNTLLGGNGNDVLSASSNQYWPASNNAMDGGNGDDVFFTAGAFGSGEAGIGALITGGLGMDTFVLRQNSDVMLNNPDSYGRPTVQDGDTVQAVFDVITDYAAGELLDLGVTTERANPVNLTHMWPGHSHITVDDGEYAFLHGNWDGGGQFHVDDEGADLLVVYDLDIPGEYYFEYSGSVVLVGVTDTASVNVGTLPV